MQLCTLRSLPLSYSKTKPLTVDTTFNYHFGQLSDMLKKQK